MQPLPTIHASRFPKVSSDMRGLRMFIIRSEALLPCQQLAMPSGYFDAERFGAAAGVTGAITQGTIANLQGFSGVGQQICCSTRRLWQEIDAAGDQTMAAINAGTIQSLNNTARIEGGLANIGQAVTNQGTEGTAATVTVEVEEEEPGPGPSV